MPVKLLNKYYNNGWYVTAEVSTDEGSIVGPQFVDLPEDATEEDIGASILALYVQESE